MIVVNFTYRIPLLFIQYYYTNKMYAYILYLTTMVSYICVSLSNHHNNNLKYLLLVSCYVEPIVEKGYTHSHCVKRNCIEIGLKSLLLPTFWVNFCTKRINPRRRYLFFTPFYSPFYSFLFSFVIYILIRFCSAYVASSSHGVSDLIFLNTM